MLLLSLTVLFLFVYAMLIVFYWKGWQGLEGFEKTEADEHTRISVVVAARNEEQNIVPLLQALEQQTYPAVDFEVIIVDDYSTDKTFDLTAGYGLRNLTLIRPSVSQELSSKKRAIETGVAIASGELIVTTDADCIPGNNWLATINSFYRSTGASFIAAPVRFRYNHRFLPIFQALDFVTLQGITAASVSTGFHNMCNGANLAYRRQAFLDVNGFEGIDKVATGDDMLLMHKIWKKEPKHVSYLKSKNAIVTTAPMPSWKEFFMQRKRWASKTFVYDDFRIIAVLAFVFLFNVLFFVLMAAVFVNSIYWYCLGGYLVLKTLIELPFVTRVARFYGDQKLLRFFFFFQPVHISYTVLAGIISQFGKYEWKGRKTK